MRITLLAVAMALFGSVLPLSAQAVMQHYQLNIPKQPLDTALKDFAHQTGLQIARMSDVVDGSAIVGPVKGEISVAEALKSLLGPRGLSYKMVNERTIAIIKSGAEDPVSAAPSINSTDSAAEAQNQEGPQRKSFWDRFRLAQVDQAASSVGSSSLSSKRGDSSDSATAETDGITTKLQEIVVTAQKRTERLQDVPVPVTAIGAESLSQNNLLLLRDYYSMVPGFSVTPAAQGNQTLSIRGISMGIGTNPTVGVTVDDVPYGSSTNSGGGSMIPDIDPSDLARVEVLRGPQGTLYGASSMGGLLKFVTADPSTDAFSGRVQAGSSGVSNGPKLGYNFRGSVNVPLDDTLAFRASGFSRQDPGYIDNVATNARGVNKVDAFGGRLSALWRPSESLSIKLSALSQEVKGHGVADIDALPGLHGLEQSYIAGTGPYTREVQSYTATLSAKLGVVDLTSVSGYNVNSNSDIWDYSAILGPLNKAIFGVPGAPFLDDARTSKFSQELRLAVQFNQFVDWLLGGFYTHEASSWGFNVLATDPITTRVAGDLLGENLSTKYQEYAGFTDLTFHFTDRFDVQLGGRESHIKLSYASTDFGTLNGGIVTVTPQPDTSADAFTYLLTPRFKVLPDLMVYARLASGYRTGGFDVDPNPAVSRQYNPDKTENYELGMKANFLDNTLSIDASVYYIDWKSIQIFIRDSAPKYASYSYIENLGKAKSQGAELEVESRPARGLKIAGWIDLSDAVLTEAFPATSKAYGVDGSRLPDSSRFSGNLSLDQEFPVTHGMTGFVGVTESYIGGRLGYFQSTPVRTYYPPYAKTDLRAGIMHGSWTANLFVTNACDKRGVIGGGLGDFPPFAFQVITPRVVGLNVTKTF